MQFTEEQKQIIQAVDGRVVVIACPGSGKTTTMLGRIDYMIKEKNIDPRRILMVTFTKAAADNMQKKYNEISPGYASLVWFGTIHSICYSILANEHGLRRDNILPRWEQIKFFKDKMENLKKESREDAAKKVITVISAAVNSGHNPETVLADLKIDLYGRGFDMLPLYKSYIAYKRKVNKIDFDDMLVMAYKCLQKSPLKAQKYQSMYDYIMIDEFQDTNPIQAKLFYLLSERHTNLCVVGDDDQSIYGFRAANPKLMLNFKKKFPDAQLFYLSCNYRSGEKIIRYAGDLIEENKNRFKKSFKAGIDKESELYLGKYQSAFQEKTALVNWVKERHAQGVPYNQMAVLYRLNKEATGILPTLKKEDVPISIRENPDNIHSHFIFDVINAYWNLAKVPGIFKDDVTGIPDYAMEYLPKVLNCPSRYLKMEYCKSCDLTSHSIDQAVERFEKENPRLDYWRYKSMREKLCDLRAMIYRLSRLLDDPKQFLAVITRTEGFEEWLDNQAEHRMVSVSSLESTVEDICAEGSDFQSMEEWMEYVGDYDSFLDTCGRNPDGLTLSTFHSAKGLEWDKIWIKNVSKKTVPYEKNIEENDEEGKEEERRMFYVAVTRARDEVNISCVGNPSEFFNDIAKGSLKMNLSGGQKSFKSLGYK